jgi:hypothetical protein
MSAELAMKLVVAVRSLIASAPVWSVTVFVVRTRFPLKESAFSKSTPAVARPTAPFAFVLRSPPARPVIARLVVEAPRETRRSVVEAKVRTDQIDDVPFALTTTSLGNVYVPAPKVPPVVVMTPVPGVYEITDVPESEVEETLFWKVVQSVEERQPKLGAPLTVLQITAPPETERPVPNVLKVDPLSVSAFVTRPCVVDVAETKRFVVEAVPVVVAFVVTILEPVTAPAFTVFAVIVPVAVREPTVVEPMSALLAMKLVVAVRAPIVSAPVLSAAPD